MTIRTMKISELDDVSNLAMESKAFWGYSSDFMEACRSELTITQSKFNDPDFHFYVFDNGNELTGYYALKYLSKDKFELDALFIKPSHIGKGIGKQLIKHAINKLEKLKAKTLFIMSDPHAEPFYASMGAKVIGQEPSGSIPGRNLPLMEINL